MSSLELASPLTLSSLFDTNSHEFLRVFIFCVGVSEPLTGLFPRKPHLACLKGEETIDSRITAPTTETFQRIIG
jgi:hypothetical protein